MTRPVQVPASNSSARKAAAEKFAYRPEDQFSIHVPETTALTIEHPDGRDLLVFHLDGTVTGDAGDASEAAAIFVREVKRMFGPPAGEGALRERVEALAVELRREGNRETKRGSYPKGVALRYAANRLMVLARWSLTDTAGDPS